MATAAAVRAYQANLEVHQGGPCWDRKARRDELKAATRHLLDATAHDPQRLQGVLALVLPILVARHRASSNIENLNSVLRPYLAVQEHAQPGMGAPQGDLDSRGPHGRAHARQDDVYATGGDI